MRETGSGKRRQRAAGRCEAARGTDAFLFPMDAGEESAGRAPYSAEKRPGLPGQTGWHRELLVPDTG